jgi:hypothetical protein
MAVLAPISEIVSEIFEMTYTKGSLTETTKTLPASFSLGELM